MLVLSLSFFFLYFSRSVFFVPEFSQRCLLCLCSSLRASRSIFDPFIGRALSHGSISPFPFMDTQWVVGSKMRRSWARGSKRRRLKRYLRPADKFIPSRERRDTGMHLYRELSVRRVAGYRGGSSREKLPMDVSSKDPLTPPSQLSLCLKLPPFHRDTDATFADKPLESGILMLYGNARRHRHIGGGGNRGNGNQKAFIIFVTYSGVRADRPP